ncbi:hypothetical protein ABTX34_11185 [Streptomyces sp. NPDC096538]|uniref:hypothetical protein n=1 Tax=Streptomyces sp. NPDC096538 TaxID=3155427 RepID=UPI003329E008
MTDHVARPEGPASSPSESLAELHRQCAEDYASNAARRAQDHRDDAFLTGAAAEAVYGR